MFAASFYYVKVATLKVINRVRQGHKCYSFSDICTADGRKIDGRYTIKKQSGDIRNNHHWPTKTMITVQNYRVWNKFLTILFKDTTWELLEPLGGWNLHILTDWLENWDWFIHQDSRMIYNQIKHHI